MNGELRWIEDAIEKLAQTAEKNGLYWRAAYTPEDYKGVQLLKQWMEEAGFQTYFDQVGNLYGRIEGESDAVFLTGSHRDTVVNGGKFDGALGIITAIAAGGALYRLYGRPKKTLEVVALCEEEGSRFLTGYVGSRALIGTLGEKNLREKDETGRSLQEAMQTSGYYHGTLPKPREDVEQFLELHIEQGGVLEKTGNKIGIVTAIVGILAGNIVFFGEQNHAGTTPMNMRKDPVPAAAAFTVELNRWALSKGTELVCTIGNITVEPGKSNVIADRVGLTFDIRSGSQVLLEEVKEKIEELMENFSTYQPVIIYACQEAPALMEKDGVSRLEALAEEQGEGYIKMASGAGHDSQIIAEKIKTNMIFVPSQKGVSHSPFEFTAIQDIAPGYELMKAYMKESIW